MTNVIGTGTYAGSTLKASTHIARMERWLGKSIDVQHVFTSWDAKGDTTAYLFEDVLPLIWSAGRIPLVTWEPFTPKPAATPADLLRRILAGSYDEYVRSWAHALVSSVRGLTGDRDNSHHLFIRLAHEANGDWYPWCPNGDPTQYVAMWRHVHKLVSNALDDESTVQWIWSVNHLDSDAVTLEELYPGDKYVDVIGVDGFNWGATQEWSEWRSAEAIFGEAISRVRKLADKPVWITEVGCTTMTDEGRSPHQKNQWIRETFDWFSNHEIQLVCWFNVDKETDWAVFGGRGGVRRWRDDSDDSTFAVYPAFRHAVTAQET